MSLKGHLGTIALPELLQWLAIGQKTGTLVIVKDDGVHRIVVDRGRIVSTSTSDPAMRLGPWLRRRGLVDQPTLERAFKLREATGMSLGRVLLTLEAVAENELRDALHDKAQELISALFHADNASFQFVEDGDLGDPGVPLSLDATQLVLSAAHHLERLPEAAPVEAGEPAAVESKPAKRTPSPPRPAPEKATATVIETLPEDLAPQPDLTTRPRHRRRTWSGVAAAVLLVATVAAVFLIGRSHVPAKAEESVDRPIVTVGVVAPPVPADLAAGPGLEFPSAPPGEVVDEPEERLSRLLVEREAELRDEYRQEIEELRRQLAAAREASTETLSLSTPEPDVAGGDAPVRETDEPAGELAEIPLLPPGLGVSGFAVDGDPQESEASGPDGTEDAAVPEPMPVTRTAARLVDREQPVYPAVAQRLGREATVTLRVLVGEDGQPARIETMGPDPAPGFDEAARAAARRSRWQPATENGTPVSSWVELRYDFELS